MKLNDIPKLMPVPFGVSGPRTELLQSSPAGDRKASYKDGFPPITMLLKSAGGLPPDGGNMNQILFELASGQRWSNAGAGYKFNATFSDAVGGYPKGAQLLSNDGTKVYVSTKDDNKTDFNTSPGPDWVTLSDYIGLGDYATKTEVELKLDKNAVVQSAGTSATSVMSQDASTKAFAPLSLYGKDSDGSAKVGSPSGAVLTFSYNGYLGTTNKDGVQVVSFTSNGVLEKGSIPVGRLTGLSDSPGQSQTAVMSQKAVTDYSAKSSVYGTDSDGTAKISTPSGKWMSVSYNGYAGVHDAQGNPLWLFDGEGKLANGTIPAARVSGLQQIGVGQKWHNRSDRQQGTTYTNDRNIPIAVSIYAIGCNMFVNEILMSGAKFDTRSAIFAIVPPGASYRCDRQSGVSENYTLWAEMY
ncbi:hypothetical protein AB2842_000804 [Morganella morganii]